MRSIYQGRVHGSPVYSDGGQNCSCVIGTAYGKEVVLHGHSLDDIVNAYNIYRNGDRAYFEKNATGECVHIHGDKKLGKVQTPAQKNYIEI